MLLRKIVGASLASLFAFSLVALPVPSASASTPAPHAVKKDTNKTAHHAKHSIFHSKKAAKSTKHTGKATAKHANAAVKTTKTAK